MGDAEKPLKISDTMASFENKHSWLPPAQWNHEEHGVPSRFAARQRVANSDTTSSFLRKKLTSSRMTQLPLMLRFSPFLPKVCRSPSFLGLIIVLILYKIIEAQSMDPQQRWLLEASFRAFENGVLPSDVDIL